MIARGTVAVVEAGSTFEGFEVRRLCGSGGMGQVFEVFDRELETPRALKIIHPKRQGDADDQVRMLKEARLGTFKHPNLVQVWAFKTTPIPYMLMEYLDGETLQARLRRDGALPLDEAVAIMKQVAAAVGALAARGLVHRDIKSANVMLVREGGREVAKLIDLGIVVPQDELLSEATARMGTPQYMTPEQAAGVLSVDGSSDVYQLGELFFEMLTGRPFCPPGPAQQQRHFHQFARRSLSEIATQPDWVYRTVARMTAKVAAERISLQEVRDTLEGKPGTRLPIPVTPRRVSTSVTAFVSPPRCGLWDIARIGLLRGVLGFAALFFVPLSTVYGYRLYVLHRDRSPVIAERGGWFMMGRTREERQQQLATPRAEMLGERFSGIVARETLARIYLAAFRIENDEVTWQQLADWLNTLFFVYEREDKDSHQIRFITHRLLGDLVDNVSPHDDCGLEWTGWKWIPRFGCALRPAERIFFRTAVAYCASIGRKLMTSQQYELAARGDSDRWYPWPGRELISCQDGTYDQQRYGASSSVAVAEVPPLCYRPQPKSSDIQDPTLDVTSEGVRHLFGNVSELTRTPFHDPANPNAEYFVFRGTNYAAPAELGTTSTILRMDPNEEFGRIATGFRCVEE